MKITKEDLSKMIQEELMKEFVTSPKQKKITPIPDMPGEWGVKSIDDTANKKKVAKKAPKKAVKEEAITDEVVEAYQDGPFPKDWRFDEDLKKLKALIISVQNEIQKSHIDPLVAKQVYLHLRQAIMALK